MSEINNLDKILSSFKIKAKCSNHKKIRNVSLYDLILEPGTRVREIEKYANEIALSLRAKNKPITKIMPEAGIVRLEVLEEDPYKISFFEEIKTISQNSGTIPMYLGSSVNGQDLWVDIAKHPHTLIAGTTGSGKSTLLHVLIANALSLKDTKLVLVDSKNVEFNNYDKINDVMVANNYKSTISMLQFVYEQMQFRYEILAKDRDAKFPNIIVIIDEFADLIMQDDNKLFYNLLCRIAQKSRAACIYCIIATQRPSVDVVKGAIKANFPARISCQVASHFDSKVILDTTGAELLAGRGDAIIKNYNNNYQRFQIAYTNQEEVYKFYAVR